MHDELDELREDHIPQFASAPKQARKTASFYEANVAAGELKPQVGQVKKTAIERRHSIARLGKMALPPEQR